METRSEVAAAVNGAVRWLSSEWRRALEDLYDLHASASASAASAASPFARWYKGEAAAAAPASTAAAAGATAAAAAFPESRRRGVAAEAAAAAGPQFHRVAVAAAGKKEEDEEGTVVFAGKDAPYTPPPPTAAAASSLYSWQRKQQFLSSRRSMPSSLGAAAAKYASAPIISLGSLTCWQDALEDEEGNGSSPVDSSSSVDTRQSPYCGSQSRMFCCPPSSSSSSSNRSDECVHCFHRNCGSSSNRSSSQLICSNCSSSGAVVTHPCSSRGRNSSSRSRSCSVSSSSGVQRKGAGRCSNSSRLSGSSSRDRRQDGGRRRSSSSMLSREGGGRQDEKELRQQHSPFPVDVDLNEKIYLYAGDPCLLAVDAVICYTRDNFEATSENSLAATLHAVGGAALQQEILRLEKCKAGEARICCSFHLPSSHIIYTVGPRTNSKYLTATHNALNGCIRESLLLLEEQGLRTVALPIFLPERDAGGSCSSSGRRQQQQPCRCRRCVLPPRVGSAEEDASPAAQSFAQQQQQQEGEENKDHCSCDFVGGGSSRWRQQQCSGVVGGGGGTSLARNNATFQRGRNSSRAEGEEEEEEDVALARIGGTNWEAFVHTTLRSLRRWLERLREKLDAIVVVAQDAEQARLLRFFFSLYFPRNISEEVAALQSLPQETGDATGQIALAARRIRIEKLKRLSRKARSRHARRLLQQQQEQREEEETQQSHQQQLQHRQAPGELQQQQQEQQSSGGREGEEQQQEHRREEQQDEEEDLLGREDPLFGYLCSKAGSCSKKATGVRTGLPVYSRSLRSATFSPTAASSSAAVGNPAAAFSDAVAPAARTAAAGAVSATEGVGSAGKKAPRTGAACGKELPTALQRQRRDRPSVLCSSSTSSSEDDEEEDEEEEGGEILTCTDVSFTEAKTATETEKRLWALRQYQVGWGDGGGGGGGAAAAATAACEDGEAAYHRYLRQANAIAECEAFKKLDRMGFLYCCGSDKAGRPLVVFLAALFPAAPVVDPGLLLLYIVKTLDPYIRDKYTLLYVNAGVQHSNLPSISLWREFFSLSSVYENTLDQLLVLHPGFFFKAAFACCWPYIASHVWSGTYYLESLKELLLHVDRKELRMPEYVLEFDAKPKKSFLGIRL